MPHRLELLDPRTDLCVRVELMLESAHGAGFIGQVRFRHPYIGGTEDTFAGTRIRLRQNGDGRHAGKRAHRFHADALKQARVLLHFSRCNHVVVNRYQHGFVEITTAWQRMTAQSLGHIAPASNLLKHSACQILFILGEEMGGAPKFLSFCLHDLLIFYLSIKETSSRKSFCISATFLYWNISVCKPHSIFSRPAQRPARSSSFESMAAVHGAQPMLP